MTAPYVSGDNKQILVGAAAFFISGKATDLPTLPAPTGTPAVADSAREILTNDTTDGWTNVGYTENGVTVSYEPTYGDVTVDQLLDSAVVFKSGMKVTVNTTFAEATLENLIVVWGQADETLDTTTTPGDKVLDIAGGSLGDFPHERALAFVGPGPRTANTSNERVYFIGRAIQTQTTAHDLKRDAATTLPVSFRCLPGNNGSYGTVRDRALTS